MSRLPAIIVVIAAIGVNAEAQTSLEYAVKAAYLVKFTPFIDWPENAFPSPGAPLNVCVIGPDPFGPLLDRAAAEQKHDGEHAIRIRRMQAPEPGCQMAFLSDAEDQAANLAALEGKPVVTVTDAAKGQEGIINFELVGNHVRFDIDQAQAEAAGIKISSKLLAIAYAVKKGASP